MKKLVVISLLIAGTTTIGCGGVNNKETTNNVGQIQNADNEQNTTVAETEEEKLEKKASEFQESNLSGLHYIYPESDPQKLLKCKKYDYTKAKGYLSAWIEDLDNDGKKELAAFSITGDSEKNGKITVEIYKVGSDGKVELATSDTTKNYILHNYVDEGNLNISIKDNKYLCIGCDMQGKVQADGGNCTFSIFHYENGLLTEDVDNNWIGSAYDNITFQESNPNKAAKLQEIGMNKTLESMKNKGFPHLNMNEDGMQKICTLNYVCSYDYKNPSKNAEADITLTNYGCKLGEKAEWDDTKTSSNDDSDIRNKAYALITKDSEWWSGVSSGDFDIKFASPEKIEYYAKKYSDGKCYTSDICDRTDEIVDVKLIDNGYQFKIKNPNNGSKYSYVLENINKTTWMSYYKGWDIKSENLSEHNSISVGPWADHGSVKGSFNK